VGHTGYYLVPTPVKITALAHEKIRQVYAGGLANNGMSFAVSADGTTFAWGTNREGELGLGDEIDRWYPTKVKQLDDVKCLATCSYHAVALTSEYLAIS
jgi:alpha-tubulin suppressor-like RCC1 family protein